MATSRKTRKPKRRNRGRCKAAKALGELLKAWGVSEAAAAEGMGVTRPAVIFWVTGRSLPDGESRRRIAIWTGDAIPVSLWDSKDTSEIRPFSPASQVVA